MTRTRLLLVLAALIASAVATISTTVQNGLRKPNHGKYVACYYQRSAMYRNGNSFFQISDIKPENCTHLIYASAKLNESTWEIGSSDRWADLVDHLGQGKDGYRQLTQLRYKYPWLTVSLAVGNEKKDKSRYYSEMAKDTRKRRRFVNSAVHFLRSFNFQGLDFNWELPAHAEYDRYNFVHLLKELREAFDKHGFLLTATITAHRDRETLEKGYDVTRIADYVDYIHLMTYDFHADHNVVMPIAPLDDVSKTIELMFSTGVSPHKFILGLPFFGRNFTLEEPLRSAYENPIGKPSVPYNSRSEPYSIDKLGVLGYNEICSHVELNHSWIKKWDNMSSTPYAIIDRKVMVYDNAKSLQDKILLALKADFGGVFIWSVDMDDFRGDCLPHHTRNRVHPRDYQYPMMQAVTYALERGCSTSGSLAAGCSAFVLLLHLLFSGLQRPF